MNDITISGLASRVFQARDVAHREHWRTSSYAIHMALNAFYQESINAIDAVTANHFNEAEKKILSQKVKEREEKKQNIFGEDGSLRAEVVGDAQEKPLVVRTIEMLTDNVI